MMPTFLELGDEVIEVDLDSPWFLFTEDEIHRHQTWSNGAQLAAWLGLSSFLVAVLVWWFFVAVGA